MFIVFRDARYDGDTMVYADKDFHTAVVWAQKHINELSSDCVYVIYDVQHGAETFPWVATVKCAQETGKEIDGEWHHHDETCTPVVT